MNKIMLCCISVLTSIMITLTVFTGLTMKNVAILGPRMNKSFLCKVAISEVHDVKAYDWIAPKVLIHNTHSIKWTPAMHTMVKWR